MDNGVDWDNDEEGIAEGALQRIQRIQHIYEEFQQRAAVAVRIQRRYPERVNPADRLTDAVFKSHFRLDKLSALRLVDLLGLHQLESNRGLPLHSMQALCICLSHFARDSFRESRPFVVVRFQSPVPRGASRKSAIGSLSSRTSILRCQRGRRGRRPWRSCWRSIICPVLPTG